MKKRYPVIRGNKGPTRCNRLVFYCVIVIVIYFTFQRSVISNKTLGYGTSHNTCNCGTYCLLNMLQASLCPSSGALELYGWLLPVVLGSLVYRSLVWCGAMGYIPQTGHITHSSTPDQRPVNQRTKYNRQQPSV
jgi:hypothetical protein